MKAKKWFGQHFLKNKNILDKVVSAANLSQKDTVLEIGPGTGTLTDLLARKAGRVVAIEKDKEFIEPLREKFKRHRNVKIVHGDILKFFNDQLSSFKKLENSTTENSLKIENWKIDNYKVVANLPYYITSRFLRIFLSETKYKPKLMVLMLQKEVAERILALDDKESLLSLSVKAYAEPEIVIKKVPKAYFYPPPKVDSAVIKITPHTSPSPGLQIENILSLARIAFQKKRKMLKNSLKNVIEVRLPSEYADKRPEELSLEDWIYISQISMKCEVR